MEYEQEIQSDITDNKTLAVITKAEIDQQITTAKAYPRSVSNFIKESRDLVMLSEDIAKECMYVLTRKDASGRKTIEGPSSRLGEIVMSCWGNCRGGARIVAEEKDFVVAQGVFHDLERNVNVTYEVKRRITKSDGTRYGTDMIGVTGNAACSIALRNAIFKGIPKAFWQGVYEAAKSTALGNEQTIKGRREKAMAYWKAQGISEDKVFRYLQVEGIEDIGLPELMSLVGLVTAIKEGDTTIEQAFADPDASPEQSKATKDLNESIRKKAAAKNGEQPKPEPEKQEEDFELEQPGSAPEFTVAEVKDKLKAIAEKAKKAKSQKAWQEVLDRGMVALDMVNSVNVSDEEYDEIVTDLSDYIKQAEEELGA